MHNLSRNCTCGNSTGFLRCLAVGIRRNNDGNVNLVQELQNLDGILDDNPWRSTTTGQTKN